jgi:hypothetical protein
MCSVRSVPSNLPPPASNRPLSTGSSKMLIKRIQNTLVIAGLIERSEIIQATAFHPHRNGDLRV